MSLARIRSVRAKGGSLLRLAALRAEPAGAGGQRPPSCDAAWQHTRNVGACDNVPLATRARVWCEADAFQVEPLVGTVIVVASDHVAEAAPATEAVQLRVHLARDNRLRLLLLVLLRVLATHR